MAIGNINTTSSECSAMRELSGLIYFSSTKLLENGNFDLAL